MIRPLGKSLVRSLTAVLAASALLVLGLGWKLTTGSLSVGFLAPYLNEALVYGKADFRAEVEDTVLAWSGRERLLEVKARQVRISNKTGQLLAVVPEISFDLSIRALLIGDLQITALTVSGTRLRLRQEEDGGIALDPSEGERAPEAIPPDQSKADEQPAVGGEDVLAAITEVLADPAAQGPLRALRRIELRDFHLEFTPFAGEKDLASRAGATDPPAGFLWHCGRHVSGLLFR